MKCDAGGTQAADRSGVRTHTRRLRALLLAAVIALGIAVVPTACSGPSDGPRPSGGVPSY
jgi:hypothetical protein